MWISRDFAIFWVAQTLSALGDAFALVAFPLLVLEATGSAVQMGLVTAAQTVASLVTGAVAGLLVDRVDRRRLMIVCDAARFLLYGAVPLCWLIEPQIWVLYVVAALGGALGMVFNISYVTAIPGLVEKDQIVAANGRLVGSNSVVYLVGPLLAGVVTAAFGAAAAIGVDGLTFLASVIGLALIRFPSPEREEAGFLVGLRFLWRNPTLRALTFQLTVIMFLLTGVSDLLIYLLRDAFHADARTIGAVLAVDGAGSIVGALLVTPLRRRFGFGPCWLGANFVSGVAIVGVGLAPGVVAVAAGVLIYTAGQTIAPICTLSLRQELTPAHLLGRVTSVFWTLHNAAAPAGAVVFLAWAGHSGAMTPMIFIGAALLATNLAALATPVRARHPEPALTP